MVEKNPASLVSYSFLDLFLDWWGIFQRPPDSSAGTVPVSVFPALVFLPPVQCSLLRASSLMLHCSPLFSVVSMDRRFESQQWSPSLDPVSFRRLLSFICLSFFSPSSAPLRSVLFLEQETKHVNVWIFMKGDSWRSGLDLNFGELSNQKNRKRRLNGLCGFWAFLFSISSCSRSP